MGFSNPHVKPHKSTRKWQIRICCVKSAKRPHVEKIRTFTYTRFWHFSILEIPHSSNSGGCSPSLMSTKLSYPHSITYKKQSRMKGLMLSDKTGIQIEESGQMLQLSRTWFACTEWRWRCSNAPIQEGWWRVRERRHKSLTGWMFLQNADVN